MTPHIIYIVVGFYGRGEDFRDWNATWALTINDANARIEQLNEEAAAFDVWRKQWLSDDPQPIAHPRPADIALFHAWWDRMAAAVDTRRRTMLDPWPYPEDGMFVDLPTYYAEENADDFSHRHKHFGPPLGAERRDHPIGEGDAPSFGTDPGRD
jgi:hypothetical protein